MASDQTDAWRLVLSGMRANNALLPDAITAMLLRRASFSAVQGGR